MNRLFVVYFLFVGVSAYNVPNETCYDSPAYDCVPGDFNLTENATICRTYATESLNWTHRIRCDGAPFYHCVMAKDLYNKEWKRFDCTFYNQGTPLRIACEKWKNVEYCEYNIIITVVIALIVSGIIVTLVYFVFMANKGNAKQQEREEEAQRLLDREKNKITEVEFKPYSDGILF